MFENHQDNTLVWGQNGLGVISNFLPRSLGGWRFFWVCASSFTIDNLFNLGFGIVTNTAEYRFQNWLNAYYARLTLNFEFACPWPSIVTTYCTMRALVIAVFDFSIIECWPHNAEGPFCILIYGEFSQLMADEPLLYQHCDIISFCWNQPYFSPSKSEQSNPAWLQDSHFLRNKL